MHRKALLSAITLCFLVIVAGCAVVVPLPPGMEVYSTEYKIKEHVKNQTSRDDMINLLGHPARQYGSDISYRACRKGAGVFWMIGIPGAGGADAVSRSEMKCFELILHFDADDRLAGYERHLLDPPFSANYRTPHGEILPYIRSMAEKGISESQWRLYDEYGRKPEDLVWLCRSAENGYGKAQLHLGNLYLSSPSISQNRIWAYIWYRHAATGDMLKGLSPDKSTQQKARAALSETEMSLTAEQLSEANILSTNNTPGHCEAVLVQLNQN